MSYKQKFEHAERVSRHIDHRKALAWFVGIFLPIGFALSAFTGWHNYLVGTPTGFHILMRAVIAFVMFNAGLVVFYFKAIRPAVLAAAAEEEGEEAT